MTLELYRRMLPLFVDEAEAKLRIIYDAITAIAIGAGAERARQDLERAVHALKGNAGILGLAGIVAVCERLERGAVAVPTSTAQLAVLHAGRCELRELLAEVEQDLQLAS